MSIPPTRRLFLTATLAPLTAGPLFAEDRPAGVPIIDTHVHCFAGTRDERFPYHARAPYRPEEPAKPQALLKAMARAGVDHVVIVHPEPYQDDHRYLEYCLAQDPKRLKGTCLFFADRPGWKEKMTALVKRTAIVTARIHAYAPKRLPPFGKPELRAFWKHAAGLGLAIQLHFEPRHAASFEPLIKEIRDARVIIDHLGRPFHGSPREHARVFRWADFPHTVMKVSSVPPRRTYPHRDITPIVKDLTRAYGAGRMIYGGGFGTGVTGKQYRAERERIASYLAHLSAADRAKILGGTAAKLFGFTA